MMERNPESFWEGILDFASKIDRTIFFSEIFFMNINSKFPPPSLF